MIHLNVFRSRRIASSVSVLSLLISFTFLASANGSWTTQGKRAAEAKEVVTKLVAGNFEGVRANFNEKMRQLSVEKMKEVWDAAIAYHGAYKSQGEARNGQQEGHDVYVIRCEMKNSPMEVVVAYDGNGKIGGLWVRPAQQ